MHKQIRHIHDIIVKT